MSAAAQPLPRPLTPDAPLSQLAECFAADPGTALPVIDSTADRREIVLSIEVERAVQDQADDVTVARLARTVPVLRSDGSVEAALSELTRNGGAGLPVGGADGTVTSWLTHRDLLRAAAGIAAGTR